MISCSRQVVDLGDDVAGALVVDLLDPLVAVHEQLAGRRARAVAKSEILFESARRPRGNGWRGRDGHGAEQSTASGRGPPFRTRGPLVIELDRRARRDPRRQDEGRPTAALESRVDDPARRRAGTRSLVRHPERDGQGAVVGTDLGDLGLERPDPGDRPVGRGARGPRSRGRRPRRPCRGPASSPSPSVRAGCSRSHRPTSSATGAPQRAQAWVSSAGVPGGERIIEVDRCHVIGSSMRATRPGRPAAYQRSVGADQVRRRPASVGPVTIAPSAPASRQRSSSSRGAGDPGSPASGSGVAPPPPSEPDDDPLDRSRPAATPAPLDIAARDRGRCRRLRRSSRRRSGRRSGRRRASRPPMRIGGGGSGIG